MNELGFPEPLHKLYNLCDTCHKLVIEGKLPKSTLFPINKYEYEAIISYASGPHGRGWVTVLRTQKIAGQAFYVAEEEDNSDVPF